jgi:hypothetical protein
MNETENIGLPTVEISTDGGLNIKVPDGVAVRLDGVLFRAPTVLQQAKAEDAKPD